jgi:hypothetical protein
VLSPSTCDTVKCHLEGFSPGGFLLLLVCKRSFRPIDFKVSALCAEDTEDDNDVLFEMF